MKNKSLLTTIIFGFLSFIVIFYSVISFNTIVNNELEVSAKATLVDMANQQQDNVNSQLDNMMYSIANIAETLPIIGVSEEEIFTYIEEKKELLNMEAVMISDLNGIVYLDSLIVDDISDTEYFKAAMSGEMFSTEPIYSEISKKEVFIVATPIYVDEKIDGVLLVEYCTEYLSSIMLTFTDGRGLSLMINSDSEILLNTSSFDITFDAFKAAKFDNGTTFESIVADFKEGKSGSISYSINGDRKFGEYRPIDINDWIIFFEISEESLADSADNISFSMIITSTLILIVAFLTVVYVVVSKNNSAKVLEKAAYYDELTDIPNLLRFKMLVAEAIKKDPSGEFVMVKMDMMNFKAINEVFGFESGDKVIKAIAETGKKVVDKSFIQARVTSDEFIFFAKKELFVNLEESSKGYEQRFKDLLPELDDHRFKFRYGRYYINHKEVDVNDMIQKTNTAHTFAKEDGVSNICDYDEKFTERVLRETEISNKMNRALENEEFKVYLQPKFDVMSEKIVGAEALVRWIEANGNMIFPNDFIPLFERNGFIVDLDMYMLSKVCEKLSSWSCEENCIPVSVNFSRLHLNNKNFVLDIKEIVDSYKVNPDCIEIELTESTVMENEKELSVIIRELHEIGFKVSIDDFGSGYSSLGMLKNFKVDTLKLDRSFFIKIADEDEHSRGNIVVENIVRLADSLGMKTVAEGIEEIEQVEFLRKINCDAAQGYFYARPLPADEFESLYFGNSETK